MAFSVRLSPDLEADARARCERQGISLNALVAVALDDYLRGGAGAARPPDGDAGPSESTPAPAPRPAREKPAKAAPGPQLNRQQRRWLASRKG